MQFLSDTLHLAHRHGLYDNPAYGVYILNEQGYRFAAEQGIELDRYTPHELSRAVLALVAEIYQEPEQMKLF